MEVCIGVPGPLERSRLRTIDKLIATVKTTRACGKPSVRRLNTGDQLRSADMAHYQNPRLNPPRQYDLTRLPTQAKAGGQARLTLSRASPSRSSAPSFCTPSRARYAPTPAAPVSRAGHQRGQGQASARRRLRLRYRVARGAVARGVGRNRAMRRLPRVNPRGVSPT